MATLPGAWHYRVSAGTGWPGVSVLWLGEMESLSATFISVQQHVDVSKQIRPWDRLACWWDIKQPTKQNKSNEPGEWQVGVLLALDRSRHRLHHQYSSGYPARVSVQDWLAWCQYTLAATHLGECRYWVNVNWLAWCQYTIVGTQVATQPGDCRYGVSARTGLPGVSILWWGVTASFIGSFSVWQLGQWSKQICPWDTLACCWEVKLPTNNTLEYWGCLWDIEFQS